MDEWEKQLLVLQKSFEGAALKLYEEVYAAFETLKASGVNENDAIKIISFEVFKSFGGC